MIRCIVERGNATRKLEAVRVGSKMDHKRILIAAASKTGTARRCAALLADRLPNGWAEVCNLEQKQPSPADYDLVVVGGSVRMGRLHKAARQYLRSNQMVLQAMPAAYFVCNCFVEQTQAILQNNIPSVLLRAAICADSFGGVMELDAQRGIDRVIAGMAAKTLDAHAAGGICQKAIDDFAAVLIKTLAVSEQQKRGS